MRWPILLLLVCGIVASSLSAHAIDRNTSFLRLDAASDLILAVDVKRPQSRAQGALLEVLDVFSAPQSFTVKTGDVIETADRITSMSSGIYGGGVCFAFLKRHKERYYSVMGAFVNNTRKRDDYERDGLLNFLGSEVTRSQVSDALQRHGELVPKLARDEARATREMPLADERPAIYARWLESGNPLLGVSALVDAFDIADEARPLFAASARKLPASLIRELQEVALDSLGHSNHWIQSVSLAVLERIGFPKQASSALRALVILKPGEHLQIVRQESYRYFGSLEGLSRDDIALLVAGLFDQSLADQTNDFAAEGIRNASAHTEYMSMLREEILELLGRDDAASLIAAARACEAIDDSECYAVLQRVVRDEARTFVAKECRPYLAGWADVANFQNLKLLIDADRDASFLGQDATRALESLVLIGGDASVEYVTELCRARDDKDPQVLAALARLGSADAAFGLVKLARERSDRRCDDYVLKFVAEYKACDPALVKALVALVGESPSASFRREAYEMLRGVLEGVSDEVGVAFEFGAMWSIEALALCWVSGERGSALVDALTQKLEHEEDDQVAVLCQIAEELELQALLPKVIAFEAESWFAQYRRASAIAVLSGDREPLEHFYQQVPIEEFTVVRLGRLPIEAALRRPEAGALLRRMIDDGIVSDTLGNTQASHITRLLGRMAGNYEGYAASLGLDARALERVRERWRAWYDENGVHLIWDQQTQSFAVKD